MKCTIEGFSQSEAIKFSRVETVKDSKGDEREKVVTLDCADLVILRWFVDLWPSMTKVELDGAQYAWINYGELLDDMPLLGIKKRMLYNRLEKLVNFGILTRKKVSSGGVFSYYGFGPEYGRMVNG